MSYMRIAGGFVRFIVSLEFDGKLSLPVNYNHIIQGFIYKSLEDKKLSRFIHSRGFYYENRSFKMFTFSRLIGRYVINPKKKEISYESPVKLIVSSCYDDFFIDLTVSVLRKEIILIGQKVYVGKMDIVLQELSDNQKIRMLSPVTVYSTQETGKTVYYSPYDDNFKRLVRENIIKKYNAFYGKEENDRIFDIEPVGKRHTKVLNSYEGFIIEGWMGEFILKGDPELIKLAYDAGIGGKNAQGFGCFEPAG